MDLLDGLDLDFLNFSKGGIFQNFDDVDIGFDNLDDLSSFRLRGMSDIEGIMSHPLTDDDAHMAQGSRPQAGSFDSTDMFSQYHTSQGGLVKPEPDAGGYSPEHGGHYSGYAGDLYGPPPSGGDREGALFGPGGGGGVASLGTSPLQYTGMDERALSRTKPVSL